MRPTPSSFNDDTDCRTAPATLGRLLTWIDSLTQIAEQHVVHRSLLFLKVLVTSLDPSPLSSTP